MKHDIVALDNKKDWRDFTPEKKFGVFDWRRTFIQQDAAIVGSNTPDCAVMVQLIGPKGNLIVAAIAYEDFKMIADNLAHTVAHLRKTGTLPGDNPLAPQEKMGGAGLN